MHIGRLYDLYGSLLTEKQRTAYELHDLEDWSLAEIAEHLGVSRQGAHELVRRARERLQAFETALGCERRERDAGERRKAMARLIGEHRASLPEEFLRQAERILGGEE